MRHLEEPLRTVEDLEKLSDDDRAELINGEIVMMTASTNHSLICTQLTVEIATHLKAKKGYGDYDDWVIIAEAWVTYDQHNSFVHDLAAFYRKDIANRSKKHGGLTIMPLWACEVMSPSNWTNDTQRKRVILEQHKVPFYWIVDPIRKTVQVFELKDKNEHYQIVYAADIGDGRVKLPPFQDLELDLTELFQD